MALAGRCGGGRPGPPRAARGRGDAPAEGDRRRGAVPLRLGLAGDPLSFASSLIALAEADWPPPRRFGGSSWRSPNSCQRCSQNWCPPRLRCLWLCAGAVCSIIPLAIVWIWRWWRSDRLCGSLGINGCCGGWRACWSPLDWCGCWSPEKAGQAEHEQQQAPKPWARAPVSALGPM